MLHSSGIFDGKTQNYLTVYNSIFTEQVNQGNTKSNLISYLWMLDLLITEEIRKFFSLYFTFNYNIDFIFLLIRYRREHFLSP